MAMRDQDPGLQDGLPVARLKPRDANDKLVILRGKAKDGARSVGRFAAVTSKLVAMIALCGAGVYFIGAAGSRTRSSYDYDFDRRMESMQQLNESLRTMQQFQNMPKVPQLYPPNVDHREYYDRYTRPSLQIDPPAVPQSKQTVKKQVRQKQRVTSPR